MAERKRKHDRVIIGESDLSRRGNLLGNAELGMGVLEQHGKHALYTIPTNNPHSEYTHIEYLILNHNVEQ